MIRPVPDAVGQVFGENPTGDLPANHWIIIQFGNYQPWGHAGQDYTCASGTPIRAITSGIVRHSGWMTGTYADNPWWCAPAFFGYGWVIEHDPVPGFPDGFFAEYGHGLANSAKFRAGQRVNEGDIIGLSGSTGGSTGPHLHLGILPSGYVLNSRFYGRIDPEVLFKGVLAHAGSTTNEGDLTVAEADRVIAHMNALMLEGYAWGGRTDNPGLIPHVLENQRLINVGLDENRAAFAALPTRVWWGTTVKRDGKEVAVIQDIATSGTITRGDSEVLVEISESVSPEALAALVPEAQAEAFIDALRARLEKPEEKEAA
jgi:murein DD-endopeptidase MepM/ murein hydrolase activator NlpD